MTARSAAPVRIGPARRRRFAQSLLLACVLLAGCKSLQPSNDRDWSPDQAVLPTAEFDGERVTLRNIRHCHYRTDEDYDVRHEDRVFRLDELNSVDFIVVPFPGVPNLAHTMLSFGFADRDYVCVSVEVRKEKGEVYDAVKGLFRQFEIMYVVGDERDLIGLRANHRLNDVYVYRTRATPQQAQALFLDVMQRVNALAVRPEFYNTLTNNCTTNIRRHINRLAPERVPYDLRVLLPGHSDLLAYELGLIDTAESFPRTKMAARVNYDAYLHRDAPDFSVKIRR